MAATYGQTLWQNYGLPAAMPFVFNALKINSTLAMIGAIVAEFFGTPIGRAWAFAYRPKWGDRSLDMVWADHCRWRPMTGSIFLCDFWRWPNGCATFWHPSHIADGEWAEIKEFICRAKGDDRVVEILDHHAGAVLGTWLPQHLVLRAALPALAADTVTLQLKWVTQAQFAGYYVAKDKGFYKDAGLDVTIKAGGPDIVAGAGALPAAAPMSSSTGCRRRWPPAKRASADRQHRAAVQEVGAWN